LGTCLTVRFQIYTIFSSVFSQVVAVRLKKNYGGFATCYTVRFYTLKKYIDKNTCEWAFTPHWVSEWVSETIFFAAVYKVGWMMFDALLYSPLIGCVGSMKCHKPFRCSWIIKMMYECFLLINITDSQDVVKARAESDTDLTTRVCS